MTSTNADRLTVADRRAYDTALTTGYLVTPPKHQNLRDTWYRQCRAMAGPYLVVTIRRAYATVDLDLISLPPDGSDGLTEAGLDAVASLARTLHPRVAAKGWRWGRMIATHGHVPLPEAPAVASALLQITRDHRSPRAPTTPRVPRSP